MPSFSDEIAKAAEGLSRFNRELPPRDSMGRFTGAGGGSTGGSFGGAAFGSAPSGSTLSGSLASGAASSTPWGAIASAAWQTAKFLGPAAEQYAITGTAAGFATGVTQSLLGAANNTTVGNLLLQATGVNAAMETTGRAGARVGAVTEDLARYGIQVSDEFRERLFKVDLEQENRVTTERGKVQALSGSAEAIREAKPEGAGGVFDAILGILRNIEGRLSSFGGGKN